MRTAVASLAMFTRDREGEREWLARWNRHWEVFHFVGGAKLDAESFRKCCVREIQEELGIVEGKEFFVSQTPLTHVEFVAWSKRVLVETRYTLEVFEARFSDESTAELVVADPRVRWLSRQEIARGRTADGSDVSETMERIISQIT